MIHFCGNKLYQTSIVYACKRNHDDCFVNSWNVVLFSAKIENPSAPCKYLRINIALDAKIISIRFVHLYKWIAWQTSKTDNCNAHTKPKNMEFIQRRRAELFSKSTSAEKSVCRILETLGIRYIRQYPIKTPRKLFYADIYIPSMRLVIEVDGGYHFTDNQRRLDGNRSACIRVQGYSIYRIRNKDAYSPARVKMLIKKHMN